MQRRTQQRIFSLLGTVVVGLGIALAALQLPPSALAQLGGSPSPSGTRTAAPLKTIPIPTIDCRLKLDPSCRNLVSIVDAVIDWMLAISSLVFIVMFFVAGIQYLVSGGEPAQTTKAKGSMLGAVIGLIVTIAAYAAVTTFIRTIG